MSYFLLVTKQKVFDFCELHNSVKTILKSAIILHVKWLWRSLISRTFAAL